MRGVPADRFQSFIAWQGEVPAEARPVPESEARERAVRWRREVFAAEARQKAQGHLFAYELRERWWIVWFQRMHEDVTKDLEDWWIETYAHDGNDWASVYFYWPAEDRWRHFLHESRGENYGRHRA
jgi:hypothetical protein